jgi:hypothetical protein
MGSTKTASKERVLRNKIKKYLRKPAILRTLFFVLRVVVWVARQFDSLS